MAPPYKLIDQATGETVWVDMDAEPGKYIEVWKGDAESSPSARISPGSLVRPGEEPEPPDPPTPPSGGNMFDQIDNEDQLADALQTYADEQRVGQAYSKVPITLSKTIEIMQAANDGTPWGANLNFMKLLWNGPGGEDMLRYTGVEGVSNSCLWLERASFFGNGYSGAAAGACVSLYAPAGDPGCIYRFTLQHLYTSWATHGVALLGAVFEGLMSNVHASDHTSNGIHMEHLNVGSPTQAIVSNVAMMHPNCSRNFGAGIRQVYSANSVFGSFVLNAEGGINGPDGIRRALASNGENTGEAVFILGSNGYGSVVDGCEGSTNGETVSRKYVNGAWVDMGKPQLYVIDDGGAGIAQAGNHISYYGDGGEEVAVIKP